MNKFTGILSECVQKLKVDISEGFHIIGITMLILVVLFALCFICGLNGVFPTNVFFEDSISFEKLSQQYHSREKDLIFTSSPAFKRGYYTRKGSSEIRQYPQIREIRTDFDIYKWGVPSCTKTGTLEVPVWGYRYLDWNNPYIYQYYKNELEQYLVDFVVILFFLVVAFCYPVVYLTGRIFPIQQSARISPCYVRHIPASLRARLEPLLR